MWNNMFGVGHTNRIKKAEQELEDIHGKRKVVNTKIVSTCDTTENWSISYGVDNVIGNDIGDKQEGMASLYNSTIGTSDAVGRLIYLFNPATAFSLNGNEFLEFWIKSSVEGFMYLTIFDIAGAYKWWYGNRFYIVGNIWTKFVLPILLPQGLTGMLPTEVSGTLNLGNMDYIEVGVSGLDALIPVVLHIDDIRAWVEY